MRRIDLHTHVFNVRYLPVAGILVQRGGLPKVIARGIAKLLNARTGDRIGHPGAAPKDLMLERAEAGLAAVAQAEAPAVGGRPAQANPAAVLAAATPPELIDDPDVREALAAISTDSPEAMIAAMAAHVDDATAQGQFQRLYAQVEHAQADNIFETAREFLAWLKFLTHSEQFIVDRMIQTYGDDVQIFVHHMMDMEHYYDPGNCYYDFVGEQLDRMRRLVDANEGRLLTFVAWSPKRLNDVNIVRRAIEGGLAVGVKVYPASGYQADDPMNDPLFDFASQAGVSLFAHCNPVGMEARRGFGAKSDPKFWSNVLHRKDEWKSLRLCLAHAGGDAPWFDRESFPGSFCDTALKLAVDPETPNVYLEFGYHDDILDPMMRKKFAALLAKKIDESGGRLGDRIVYGTDWHMIERLPKHRQYFAAFQEVFSRPPLDAFADRFFFQNAVNFLNLGAFAGRRAPDDPVRLHVERVIDAPDGPLQREP